MSRAGSGECRVLLGDVVPFGHSGVKGCFSHVKLHFLILAHALVLFTNCRELFCRESI